MGNCFRRCFGVVDQRRKRYAKANYTDEQDFSIEFENLIGEEPQRNETARLLTDRERQLLSTKQFGVLALEQRRLDVEIEAKLTQQEMEIEREESAFYEAKREAARIAKLNKDKEETSKSNMKAWVNTEEWEIAGDEDDFENFLATVKARSLVARTEVQSSYADVHMSPGSSVHTEDQNTIDRSYVDVEWDQETVGSSPQRQMFSQDPKNSLSKPAANNSKHSADLDWEADFVGVDDDHDRVQILAEH